MTCPYCPRPIPDQPGRVTCGRRVCQTRHRRQTCKTCQRPMPARVQHAACRRRGFCGVDCLKAYAPRPRLVLCAHEGCRRGEGHTRKVFRTLIPDAECCCSKCGTSLWHRRRAETLGYWHRGEKATPEKGAPLDLRPDQIDALLAKLAATRRATRTGMRLDDETILGQRAGSALHQRGDLQTMDLEGSFR